ncbi:Casein kinase II subunit beta [Entamoeba marina]
MNLSDRSDSDGDLDDMSWIEWFCSLRGNEFLCMVDEGYIQDEFNLYGLQQYAPNFEATIDMILDLETPEVLTEDQQLEISKNAHRIYGLIHARYITTTNGLLAMQQKYRNSDFGTCPRILCHNQPLLPVGLSDLPDVSSVKMYCPECGNLYDSKHCKSSKLDGAFFGTTFPHLLLMQQKKKKESKSTVQYVPRVFGFQVSPLGGAVVKCSASLPCRKFCFYKDE